MKPRFSDGRSRYRNAAETSQPGYLARRMKAYARLQRMKARSSNLVQIKKVKAAA